MKLLSIILSLIISVGISSNSENLTDLKNTIAENISPEKIKENKQIAFIAESPYYRFLDMTPDEIISEYGGMKFEHGFAGAAPCYSVTGFDSLDLLYLGTDLFMDEPLADTDIPDTVMMWTAGAEILPGITIGMSSAEFTKILPIGSLNYSLSDSATGFSSGYIIGGYRITALWGYPDGFYGLEGMDFLYPNNVREMRGAYTKMYTYAMNTGLVDTPLCGVYISKYSK